MPLHPVSLDGVAIVNVKAAMANVQRNNLVPDLKGVDVYALGVDAAGKQVPYWQSLRAFWAEYSAGCGLYASPPKPLEIGRIGPRFARLGGRNQLPANLQS